MQYPGATPFSGFGGSNALTNGLNHLNPSSLEQRKRQLVNRLVTGGMSHANVPGSGVGFRGDANMGSMGFLSSILNSENVDAPPPFYGGSGGSVGGDPSGGMTPAAIATGGASASPSPAAAPPNPNPFPNLPGSNSISPAQQSQIQQVAQAMLSGGASPTKGLSPAMISSILMAHTRGY